jgi:formate hydrogenlyase transcriptional activator
VKTGDFRSLVIHPEDIEALRNEHQLGLSRGVLLEVSKVAPTDSTVLILGETGTGKELIARASHHRSKRSTRAFIRVNCAAIPPSLIASELFGHEKGSFTGALQRHLGRFESADGGTLFLDEVGELPAETRVALVGGRQTISVDVRVSPGIQRRGSRTTPRSYAC